MSAEDIPTEVRNMPRNALEDEVSRLRRDLAQLNKQVTSLQTLSTKQLEELRAFRGTGETKLSRDVREFMTAFGQHAADKPSVPPDDVVRLRLRLVVEEMFELLSACDAFLGQGGAVERYAKPEVDLVELADALADIDYVVSGTRIAFGILDAPIANEVHRSNMAKAGGKLDEHGKLRKPEGWTPPDIEGELIKQGWVRR